MNNSSHGIIDYYKNEINSIDENGYSEIFKKCTDTFFNALNKSNYVLNNFLHFEDIKYLDGYFIFPTGSNSIVHFHIKECPGWLFGIWWHKPEDQEISDSIEGDFFAQYEATIDKFKPSRSNFCEIINVIPDNLDFSFDYSVARMINFIINEPYLSFCRDYNGWNYNEEFHTREEAKIEFDKYWIHRNTKIRYTKEFNEKIINFIKEKIFPYFTNAELVDNGENCSPRYDLMAPFDDNKDIIEDPGCYSWFDKNTTDLQEKKINEEYDALVKECINISDKYNFFWLPPCNKSIIFYGIKEE